MIDTDIAIVANLSVIWLAVAYFYLTDRSDDNDRSN